MKKLCMLLTVLLLLSLFAGCRQEPAPTASTAAATAAPASAAADTAPADTVPADADAVHPMLFRVSGENGREAYLFGTIHVGDARVDTALQKLTPYLDACDALAVEFDILAFEQDRQAQMDSMTRFLLTDGSRITDHMPQELYERAFALLGEAGLYPKLMEMYNLSMWSQLVEQAALITRTDYDLEIGMDRSLIRYCYDKHIEVRDVESAELQYALLAGLSDELNLLLIESTLDSLDSYGESIDQLYSAWLEGDPEAIEELLSSEESGSEELTEDQRKLLEDYYDQLLTQRNLGMRDKALQWLEAGDKLFFAVGAAHLLGEGGLIALLRDAGYTVEQVSYQN